MLVLVYATIGMCSTYLLSVAICLSLHYALRSYAVSCILSYLHCKSWILRARACRSMRLVHGLEVIGSAAVTCSRRMSLKICVFGSEEMCYVNSGCNFFFRGNNGVSQACLLFPAIR